MTNTALEAKNITAHYGSSQILFGVDLSVEKGQMLALLGRNGAGKSTTLKALMGLIPQRTGSLALSGRDVTARPTHELARLGLGFVPEDRQVFTHHTVQQNIEIALKPGPDGLRHWTLETIYADFPMLSGLRRRQAGRLSGGEQQMLAIGRTLAGNPTTLLLDEPSEGLAPIIVSQIANALMKLRDIGTTGVIAEQNMQFCLKVATHIAVIDSGRIVYRGTRDDFRSDPSIAARYLSA